MLRDREEENLRVWGRQMECLQWDFDAEKLEAAVSQLVGEPILMGGARERPGNEVVRFSVTLDPPSGGQGTVLILEVGNRLTRETASSLLHLFHHLGTGTYVGTLVPVPWNCTLYAHWNLHWTVEEEGTHFNPAIFTALLQARGGKKLELHAVVYSHCSYAPNIFEEVLGKTVAVYSKRMNVVDPTGLSRLDPFDPLTDLTE